MSNSPQDFHPDNIHELQYFVRFRGGPIDGVKCWATNLEELLVIPVNPKMIENPSRIVDPNADWGPITSVALYNLENQKYGSFYVFERSIDPRDLSDIG